MLKKLLAIGLLTGALAARAQTPTFPRNDIADDRSTVCYALINATIVQDPTTTLENATLLVKGGVVQAVGRDVKWPAGTVVYDLKGKRIYPAFVDVYADYGMPEIRRAGGGGGRSTQLESSKKGPYAWNAAIQPETNAEELLTLDARRADELRKLGFGAVLSHQADGIARGTGVLVQLLDGAPQDAVLKGRASAHYSLSKGTSTQAYPTSPMGAIALLRQTYYDANWYKRAMNKTEYNVSLDHFNHVQGLPQFFEASDKLTVLIGDRIGDEFGVQYIIKGKGDEYQRLDEIKATGASLVVPLNFPAAMDVEDPNDALLVSLTDLKHWELAPTNAGRLAGAGVPFALTTAGLRSRMEFWPNLRKAIASGLPEAEALKALTTTPAALLNMGGTLGSLKPGMQANFLVTSGNVFRADNILYETWVKGRRHILVDPALTDIRGTYELKLGDKPYRLSVMGTPERPALQLVDPTKDSTRIPVRFSRNGELVTLAFKPQRDAPGDARLSGYVAGDAWQGTGQGPDGAVTNWSATRTRAYTPPAPRADAPRVDSVRQQPVGKVLYPFIAFGNEEKPKAEKILVRNATVWTNERDGIVTGTDVLLDGGKIARVGKNLSAAGARVIDGTGKHLTNGIFDEHSHIALLSINEGGQSVTSEVRQGDVIDSEDINIYRQLAGGVTSSQLLHGSANSIGGQSAIIKLKWGEAPEALKIKGADGFIKFALGENVTRKNFSIPGATPRYPISRMGVEQVMMDAFQRARDYEKSWKAYDALPSKEKTMAAPPRRDLELDALVEILNKKRFITCHSYVQSEINMLMKVAEAFNFRINTFTHILEGYKLADLMAKHGAGGSSFADWWAYKMEVKDAIPYNPALMHRAGVLVSINSDDAEMARRLNQEAAKSVEYGGLSEEEAWKMVTLNPAKLLHLDNRLGSIKAGKDADVVLWNTNPLSIYAKPEKTIIDGAVYYDAELDAKKRQDLETERNRLIQKLLAAKATSTTPLARPTFRPGRMFHCEDVEGLEEFVEGSHGK
jgi:imidazolonepropionase-like amidohydrolase